ncbi:MAG: hypothetical protein EXS63_06925 [Candidatus Omnitrophica bacterium]|nr:hypothetical protein [Candidatus Omnitrophota bacterium]
MKNVWMVLLLLSLSAGCAGEKYFNGVGPNGQKIYLGPVPIEKTEAYQAYTHSSRTEADKQRYLFQRLKSAVNLSFYHDGNWYNSVQAYRGGMWLMRKRYLKGQATRDFIHKYVERSEETGEFHLAKFPDGSIHIASYLLYNELDLLEDKQKSGKL